MPDPPFDRGDTVRIRTVVTDADTASPVSPSTVMLRVTNPSAVTATYRSAGASPPLVGGSGIYYIDYALDVVGSYAWRWDTMTPNSAEEGVIHTATSRF